MIKSLNRKQSLDILRDNYIGYLSYIYQDKPFVIPITYFFHEEDGTIICYSGGGHKIKAMRQNKRVSLQVPEIVSVSCWESILVQGSYDETRGSETKRHLHLFAQGIKQAIERKEKKRLGFISEFSSKIYNDEISIVFVIKIEEITGKERRY